jgi:hypothetical protein
MTRDKFAEKIIQYFNSKKFDDTKGKSWDIVGSHIREIIDEYDDTLSEIYIEKYFIGKTVHSDTPISQYTKEFDFIVEEVDINSGQVGKGIFIRGKNSVWFNILTPTITIT